MWYVGLAKDTLALVTLSLTHTTPHQCGWTALLHAAAATAASSGPGGAARDEVVKTLLNHAANPRLKDNVLWQPAAQ